MEGKITTEVFLAPKHASQPFFSLTMTGLRCDTYVDKSDTEGRATLRRALEKALMDLDALEDPMIDPPDPLEEIDGPIMPKYPLDCGSN